MLTNRDFFTCCWVSLLEKLKRTTENRPAKTLAYNISHKINGGPLRSDRLFFSSLTIFSVIQRFLQFFSGVEKTQEDAVPQNGCENDAAKGSMNGDVVVCFVK